jgi:hypothetical protein
MMPLIQYTFIQKKENRGFITNDISIISIKILKFSEFRNDSYMVQI